MDRSRAAEARDEADSALTERGAQELELAAIPDEARRATDKPTEFCPATVPCIGRPAFVIIVPVRVIAAGAGPQQVGAHVGDVEAVYCPECRTMTSRTRQPAG